MSLEWIGLIAALGYVLGSVHMWARPQRYVGSGTFDARDPNTVRQFGKFGVVLGLAVLALTAFKLTQG